MIRNDQRSPKAGSMLLLIDNYDSFTYNLVHYIGELGQTSEVRRNDKITVAEALALKPKAIVLSPGPCTPTKLAFASILSKPQAQRSPCSASVSVIRPWAKLYGGSVKRAPSPMHGKMSTIKTTWKWTVQRTSRSVPGHPLSFPHR